MTTGVGVSTLVVHFVQQKLPVFYKEAEGKFLHVPTEKATKNFFCRGRKVFLETEITELLFQSCRQRGREGLGLTSPEERERDFAGGNRPATKSSRNSLRFRFNVPCSIWSFLILCLFLRCPIPPTRNGTEASPKMARRLMLPIFFPGSPSFHAWLAVLLILVNFSKRQKYPQ